MLTLGVLGCGGDQGLERCHGCLAPDASMGCFKVNGAEFRCVQPCESGCFPGHTCVSQGGRNLCSPFCDDHACLAEAGAPMACTGPCGQCRAVGCTADQPCPQPTQYCDQSSLVCRETDGTCTTAADCLAPVLVTETLSANQCDAIRVERKYGQIVCADGRCRMESEPLVLPFLPADASVTVVLPSGTEPYSQSEDIAFEWLPFNAPFIAFVLGSFPSREEDLVGSVLWAFSGSSGLRRRVVWSEGKVMQAGAWVQASAAPPTDRTLYFLIQAIESGQLVARSEPVPFVVGAAWPAPGDPCVDTPDVPDDCHNPGRTPQVCHAGVCWTACGSDLDCPLGIRCGLPSAKDGRFRLCGN